MSDGFFPKNSGGSTPTHTLQAIIFIVATFFFTSFASATTYKVISVYDGDTFTINEKVFPTIDKNYKVRIRGIDTPEIKGKCSREIELAKKAQRKLTSFIGYQVTVTNAKLGKYAGRVIADVSIGGIDAAQYMIKNGYARVYGGGKRLSWCKE